MSELSAKLIEFNGTSKERKAIDEVSKVAQKVLKDERHINITMHEAIGTIAYEFFYAMAQYIEKNKSVDEDIEINFFNFLSMGATYRSSEEGEKEGNFTPYLLPGVILKTVIKSDEVSEDDEE